MAADDDFATPEFAAVVVRAVENATFPRPTPLFTIFNGVRIWAVGDRIYWRPIAETPFDFLAWHLSDTIGSDWLNGQRQLPELERHELVKWIESYESLRSKNRPVDAKPGDQFSAKQTGFAREVIALSYNLFLLRVENVLSDSVLDRLRKRDQFQGAQYEITVAAALARVGFTIEWIDKKSGAGKTEMSKTPEFNARHKASGEVFAVEAKSKHWEGIKGRPGDPPAELHPKIHRLLNDALTHDPGNRAFVPFLDVNVPRSSERRTPDWQGVLQETLSRFRASNASSPLSAVVVTNIPWHFRGETPPSSLESAVVRFVDARHPLNDHTVAAIGHAMEIYGLIDPERFFDEP